MGSYDGVAESRLRSNSDQVESRLDLQQVPEQISRIFFGSGSGKPTYGGVYSPPSTGYGVPASPVFNSPGIYYDGYEDDIYLLMKLGIAGIIVFIILAVIIMIALLCLCCFKIFKKDSSSRNNTDQPFKGTTYPLKNSNGFGPQGTTNQGFSNQNQNNSGGFANTGTLPAGTGGSNIQANNTPAGLTRNPGLQNLSSILDTPSEDDTVRDGGRVGRSSSPRTPASGGRGRSRSKGRGRDTPRGGSGSSMDTSSLSANMNPNSSTWNDTPWSRRTGIASRDLEPQISSESNNISQNRSISYYEVPVATTMSTFTYDIPPQNSTATANASTNVTAVRSPYLTAGTPAYNRYSTINRDRGLV